MCWCVRASRYFLARPKSMMYTRLPFLPSPIKKLSGFTSRWMKFLEWMYSMRLIWKMDERRKGIKIVSFCTQTGQKGQWFARIIARPRQTFKYQPVELVVELPWGHTTELKAQHFKNRPTKSCDASRKSANWAITPLSRHEKDYPWICLHFLQFCHLTVILKCENKNAHPKSNLKQ